MYLFIHLFIYSFIHLFVCAYVHGSLYYKIKNCI